MTTATKPLVIQLTRGLLAAHLYRQISFQMVRNFHNWPTNVSGSGSAMIHVYIGNTVSGIGKGMRSGSGSTQGFKDPTLCK